MAFLRRDRSVERLVDDDGRQAVVIEEEIAPDGLPVAHPSGRACGRAGSGRR
jgi:hypothetical protein